MAIPFRLIFWLIFTVFSLLGPLAAASARAADSGPPPEAPPTDIQKTINLLEDEDSRREIITLLKLLAALDREKAEAVLEQLESGQAAPISENKVAAGFLSGLAEEFRRELGVSWNGLRQSARAMKNVGSALRTPEALEMWRPYLLKIFSWGLACLLAAFFVIKKYGRPPEAADTSRGRFRAAAKHLLIVTAPNLILILSLLAFPSLSTTARGVTADLALGFSFIHIFIRHFFVSLSLLYIFLEAIKILFTPDGNGRALVGLHPLLARHLGRSLRVFAVYATGLVFFKEAFMGPFLAGSLYLAPLVALTLPIPVYLTARLIKLRRLVRETAADPAPEELEAAADSTGREPAEALPLLYPADLFLRKYWAVLSVLAVWALWLLSLVNPADTRFAGQGLICLILLGLAGLAVATLRRVLGRVVSPATENGRNFLRYADLLICVLIGLAWTALAATVWGLPWTVLLGNAVLREVAGRALAIAAVIVALSVFVKFSRLATDWLLSSPELAGNRNWRTMTPLALTAVRALAAFTGVVVILERLGVNIGPILAGAGILGLGVGMGAQSLVKDVINGLTILFMDTLSVGDYVTVGGLSGTVETVGLRSLRLRDAAGNLTVVPNSVIDTIVNMTRDYSQDLVEFVVPCDADPDAMLAMTREVAEELSRDPDWEKYLTDPVSVLGFTAFDANGSTIRLKISTSAGSQWAVGRELRLRLKRRMLREGLNSTWFGQNVFYRPGK